jgi:hypothetical protein
LKKAKNEKNEKKAKAALYLKLVEWSNEDGCFVGSTPTLIGQSCLGKDETKVHVGLCPIITCPAFAVLNTMRSSK